MNNSRDHDETQISKSMIQWIWGVKHRCLVSLTMGSVVDERWELRRNEGHTPSCPRMRPATTRETVRLCTKGTTDQQIGRVTDNQKAATGRASGGKRARVDVKFRFLQETLMSLSFTPSVTQCTNGVHNP